MDKIMQTAVNAAHNAGRLIREAAQDLSGLNVEQKTLHDYVSDVDRNSESLINQIIKEVFPDHMIKGEEHGVQSGTSNEHCWVIDPLDGTTNFLRGIPHYAVSIALLTQGEPSHAIVFDPIKNEMFTAIEGQGAKLNDMPISCSSIESAKGGLYATGVPFNGKPLEKLSAFTNTMHGVLEIQTSGIRRLGSAALDLAYVAAGRYDGYWESNLQVWDIAAGVLLVKEAGGLVSDLRGGDEYLDSGDVLAASAGAYGELLEVCQKEY